MLPPPPRSTLFPYTTLFRSPRAAREIRQANERCYAIIPTLLSFGGGVLNDLTRKSGTHRKKTGGEPASPRDVCARSEEHTSELQSQSNLVCRLLLEKKKMKS